MKMHKCVSGLVLSFVKVLVSAQAVEQKTKLKKNLR